ncbi:MAG: hypothetical protein JWR07_878 [Nevskia sp.]|nr:hypothetical protein [Nevskia sp.]
MKHGLNHYALIGAGLLALSACSNDNNSTPPLAGAFRIANGITDSIGLDAALSNVASFSGISYGTGSGIVNPPTGSYKTQLTSNSVGFSVDNTSIDHNNVTTVFAAGQIGNGSQKGFVAEQNLQAPSSGQFNVQFVADAASRTGPINFFLITPGGSITGKTANATVEYPFNSSPTSPAFSPTTGVATGTYEIVVTNALGVKLFDSGTKGVTLPTAGNVLQIAAIDAPTGSPASTPLAVVVLDNNGGNTNLQNGAN